MSMRWFSKPKTSAEVATEIKALSGDTLSPQNLTKLRVALIREQGSWDELLGSKFGRWPQWCARAAAELTGEALDERRRQGRRQARRNVGANSAMTRAQARAFFTPAA